MITNKAKILIVCTVVLVMGIFSFFILHKKGSVQSGVSKESTVAQVTVTKKPVAPIPLDIQGSDYYTITIKTTDPVKEIASVVGEGNVGTVLKLNRINSKYLKTGSVLVVPKLLDDFMSLSPFPAQLPAVQSVPKLLLVSQRMQAFGVYEFGVLVRWGPVSTGKESTQTPSKLFYTNWKGKEVHSTFSDEWILKWNFNLDNAEGIGMHQYEMPGYPASHSCIRLFGADAEWLYNWADQWVLSADQKTVVKHGTPVLVFGTYLYGKTAPWKNLPKNPTATMLSVDEVGKSFLPSISNSTIN